MITSDKTDSKSRRLNCIVSTIYLFTTEKTMQYTTLISPLHQMDTDMEHLKCQQQ